MHLKLLTRFRPVFQWILKKIITSNPTPLHLGHQGPPQQEDQAEVITFLLFSCLCIKIIKFQFSKFSVTNCHLKFHEIEQFCALDLSRMIQKWQKSHLLILPTE